ncbi:GerMN domain-containing protein [Bacillota bacterium LX-D]|nr:GerMN domain-containing protein [Bacillota bacterium LX-D]
MFRLQFKKSLCLLVFATIMLAIVAGCSTTDTLSSLKAKFSGNEEPTSANLEESTGIAEDQIASEEAQTETTKVLLYFSNADGKALVAEERTIPKVDGLARETINQLIQGPEAQSKLKATIPAGTKLKDINIRPDGKAIVDFSQDLVTNYSGDGTAETLTVYSIVNTLTQFPTVKEVQILVDGKQVETIGGHVKVSSAMTRDDKIIE